MKSRVEDIESDVISVYDGQEQDNEPGPFYAFTPGMPLYNLIDQQAGVERIETGKVTKIDTHTIWLDPASANEKGGRPRLQKNKFSGEVILKTVPIEIPARAVRNQLLEMYGKTGLIFIKAFASSQEEEFDLDAFNELIRPTPFGYYDVPEELLEAVETRGALAVFKDQVLEFQKAAARPEFAREFGQTRARVYRDALKEIVISYNLVERYAKTYLNEQDKLVRQQINGGVGKPGYDDCDKYYQWLLARSGVDDATTRALEAVNRPVRVEIEQQKSNGEDIGKAVAAAMAEAAPSIAAGIAEGLKNLFTPQAPPAAETVQPPVQPSDSAQVRQPNKSR